MHLRAVSICIKLTAYGSYRYVDAPAARLLLAQHKPDIVIFGHSHVYGHHCSDGVWFINAGGAGPARFKLKRTAALLHLPEKGPGAVPRSECLELEGKAPPRLCAESRKQRQPAEAADGDLRNLHQKSSRLGKRRR
jgi:Calcineurin-like phosphoesterase superfamily domain